MPHYVASDLGLYCLSITLYGFPGKNGLMVLAMCTLIMTKSVEHLTMASLLVHWQSDQLPLCRNYVKIKIPPRARLEIIIRIIIMT